VIGERQGNIYCLSGLQEVAYTGQSRPKDYTTKEIWHRRIAHRSLSESAVSSITKSVTDFNLTKKELSGEGICTVCAEGKQRRESLTGERKKSTELLNTIHSDVCGPMATTGLMGERYFATFIDEYSGRIALSLLTQKSEAFERFKHYKEKIERETGKKVKSLRCDGGGEYTGKVFQSYLTEHGIIQRITPAYTPEHNGIAERANRTIMEMVRCMLFDSRMGKEFWGFAALTAVHIINRLPSSAHEGKTRFEMWFGVPPSIGHLRVFGCLAYRHIPSAGRRKLDPKAQKCRMIGYKEESGSCIYRVYDATSKQVLITRDVVFDETTTIKTTTQHTERAAVQVEGPQVSADMQQQEGALEDNEGQGQSCLSSEDEEGPGLAEPLPPIDPDEGDRPRLIYDCDTITVRHPEVVGNRPNMRETASPAAISKTLRPERTRPVREMFRPAAWQAFIAVAEEPITLQEALAGKDRPAWKAAWEGELDSLQKNGTWVVENAPLDRNIVGCRWLFKQKEDGRFKVRLVAKGYSQEPGIDFQETFAPVAKFTTLGILLAPVAENNWELHSMDVKTAFLNGVLEEEIFMECPEGIMEEYQGKKVCRLVKAIYGLRQSPRAWYQKVHSFFLEHQFFPSTQDYSLYINYERKLLVLVYVDDLVLAAASLPDIVWIKTMLAKAFEMTNLGELSTFLGLEISRDRGQRLLSVHQGKYIEKILCRHGIQDARPSLTPLNTGTRLLPSKDSDTGSQGLKTVSLQLYQSAVGALMYAMLGTRPDIAYAVGIVSQYNHAPVWEHWMAVKQIFRYLAGTRGLCLRYGATNSSGGYSDADWGSGNDRKSVGGYVFLLN